MEDAPNLAGFDDLPVAAPAPEVPRKLTDEERRAAELAVGARTQQENAKKPQPIHPSIENDPDMAAQLYAQRQLREQEKLDAERANESEAARTNREVYERIRAARNQPLPPPPPPPPVAPGIVSRTQQEMEAGRRAIARAQQQQLANPRPAPTPKEIAAQGTTTTVFSPDIALRSEALPPIKGEYSTNDQKRGVRSL